MESVYKVNEGRPNIVDLDQKREKSNLLINTPLGRESFYDEKSIRRAAIRYNIPCITTLSAASAAARGIRAMAGHEAEVNALQDLHRRKSAASAAPLRVPLRPFLIKLSVDFRVPVLALSKSSVVLGHGLTRSRKSFTGQVKVFRVDSLRRSRLAFASKERNPRTYQPA